MLYVKNNKHQALEEGQMPQAWDNFTRCCEEAEASINLAAGIQGNGGGCAGWGPLGSAGKPHFTNFPQDIFCEKQKCRNGSCHMILAFSVFP